MEPKVKAAALKAALSSSVSPANAGPVAATGAAAAGVVRGGSELPRLAAGGAAALREWGYRVGKPAVAEGNMSGAWT